MASSKQLKAAEGEVLTSPAVWRTITAQGRKVQSISTNAMICPRCKRPMREERRAYHKKRKWVCPQCGKVRMQVPKKV